MSKMFIVEIDSHSTQEAVYNVLTQSTVQRFKFEAVSEWIETDEFIL